MALHADPEYALEWEVAYATLDLSSRGLGEQFEVKLFRRDGGHLYEARRLTKYLRHEQLKL
eukprot:72706-Amphidinium_carterae.1